MSRLTRPDIRELVRSFNSKVARHPHSTRIQSHLSRLSEMIEQSDGPLPQDVVERGRLLKHYSQELLESKASDLGKVMARFDHAISLFDKMKEIGVIDAMSTQTAIKKARIAVDKPAPKPSTPPARRSQVTT